MQIYKAPIADFKFILETFGYDQVSALEQYEAFDLETTMMLLEQSGNFATKEMLPANRQGDQEGVSWNPETGEVTTPKSYKKLYKKFIANGFGGIACPESYGGGGAPYTIALMLSEIATAANKSFSMMPGLSHGLIDSLTAFGTDALKKLYLPKLISGEWGGTMCLTEPQAGTDLGLISTKAIAAEDGDGYLLTGTKIWITFGEHDLTENIAHLVLARMPDAPPGIKGISAFVVPKLLEDGSRNGVACGGLEHKMGINGSPTCVMNFENARGWLLGEPHKGMRSMFVMMNAARLSVGLEGVALSEISYQTALEFAKDRRQSRSLDRKKQDRDAKADTIMVHPDVRRMLLNIKSTQEGMRGLAYWLGINYDLAHHHPDAATRERCDDLVGLLTPVVKSYLTERGFQNISDAMQVMGGAGYTTDWSVEQYMRDCRIGMIYEGTNHIQALDLVGRKLPRHNGRAIQAFAGLIKGFCAEHKENAQMAEFIAPLKKWSKTLSEITMGLAMKGMADPEEAGAAASNYLNLFAMVAIGYVWAREIVFAQSREGRIYTAKIKTGRYFFNHVMPEAAVFAARVNAGKADMMDLDVDEF